MLSKKDLRWIADVASLPEESGFIDVPALDPEIEPLVYALCDLRWLKTTGSCWGHGVAQQIVSFEAPRPETDVEVLFKKRRRGHAARGIDVDVAKLTVAYVGIVTLVACMPWFRELVAKLSDTLQNAPAVNWGDVDAQLCVHGDTYGTYGVDEDEYDRLDAVGFSLRITVEGGAEEMRTALAMLTHEVVAFEHRCVFQYADLSDLGEG